MHSDFVWFDRSEEYNTEINFTNSGSAGKATLTIHDVTDTTNPDVTVVFDNDAKTSETPVSLVNGHEYCQTIAFSNDNDTNAKITYEGLRFTPKVIHVTGVTLNHDTLEVEKTGAGMLEASVIPVDSTDPTVSWSSSDEAIATVEDGVVTGVKEGEAVITVTTTDGGFTASCNVTVYGSEVIHPTSVTVSPSTASVKIGQTTSLTATVLPANATYKAVTWSSSDETVATVD